MASVSALALLVGFIKPDVVELLLFWTVNEGAWRAWRVSGAWTRCS